MPTRTMQRKFRPPVVPISPGEAERRREDIASKREYLGKLKSGKELEGQVTEMATKDIDVGALERQLDRDERALAFLAPKEGTATEKKKAQKEFDEAKAYIEKHALTRAEQGMWPSRVGVSRDNDDVKHQDYTKACEKAFKEEVGNPEFQRQCERLKRAAAILAPEDPELRNINNYRRDK